ncbi:cysteine desulfurase family protein [Geobacter sp. SVR]|uniref:cysteine desulfurase family protein n=1 Tax=Geobacter sp. SVR TaxID=2495594 RepID=UPI00143EFC8F|nr:cysteine desulfurase family protein [Geobacter sp. SVR]BCS52643.1 cysteine desulfurase IscS [Geobacter sp. SVR]GCF83920.1 cysteine desulfurase IscS [Geobacter sp. SVR]
MEEPIYLDHNATTPVDRRVLEKMLPYFCEVYGNAASIDHIHGNKAKQAVDEARQTIAKLLGCRKESEIVFTSGATEANNLALIGAFRKFRDKGRHIISSIIEHPAVLDTLNYLKCEGAEITLVPVDACGVIDLEALEAAITKETILISVMFANNEIGTIQPIKEIGALAKSKSILFHTDAAQAAGHEKINVYDMDIDLLSFSAHKFCGPKGIGGLFVRSYSPLIKLSPISFGGGHEKGMRSGTLNVPGIVGMAEALSLANKEMKAENNRLMEVASLICQRIQQTFPDIKLNGHPQKRLSHNLNLTIPGVEAKALIHLLKNKLSFSAGSACSTVKVEPSHVLKSIGITDEEAFQTIRLGLGQSTLDAQRIADALIQGILRIKG